MYIPECSSEYQGGWFKKTQLTPAKSIMELQVLYQYWQQGRWIILKGKQRKPLGSRWWWLVALSVPALHSYLWIQECLLKFTMSHKWAKRSFCEPRPSSLQEQKHNADWQRKKKTAPRSRDRMGFKFVWIWGLSWSWPWALYLLAWLSSCISLFAGNLPLSWWQQGFQQPQDHNHSAQQPLGTYNSSPLVSAKPPGSLSFGVPRLHVHPETVAAAWRTHRADWSDWGHMSAGRWSQPHLTHINGKGRRGCPSKENKEILTRGKKNQQAEKTRLSTILIENKMVHSDHPPWALCLPCAGLGEISKLLFGELLGPVW